MSCDRVVFAVRASETDARARLRRVLRFYGPCGVLGAQVRRDEALGVTVGEIRLADPGRPDRSDPPGDPLALRRGAVFSFGERLPQALSTAESLLDASDSQLRALDGFHAVLAAQDGRARLVTGSGAPRSWFSAGDAFATSASAAALLGGKAARVDPRALPELMALGFCLDERTHLSGVRALPPASVVDIGAGEREIWPRLARWAWVELREAPDVAWTALLETLDRRLVAELAPWLELTDALDAPLLLAAASALGRPLPVYSIDSPGAIGITTAETIADAYGAVHTHCAAQEPESEPDAHARLIADAIWGDGVLGLSPFRRATVPPGATALIKGTGGEAARAGGHEGAASHLADPGPRDLIAALGVLERVPVEHREPLWERLSDWLSAAHDSGHDEWSALSMLAIEHRVGRSRGGRHGATPVEPLCTPEVARALVSLPLDDRLSLAWHRRAIAELALPDAAPAPGLRRRLRSTVGGRVEHQGSPAQSGLTPWADAHEWQRLPRIRDWLVSEPLSSPVLAPGLGEDWARWLRDGLLSGDSAASEQALLAAPVAILDEQLRAA